MRKLDKLAIAHGGPENCFFIICRRSSGYSDKNMILHLEASINAVEVGHLYHCTCCCIWDINRATFKQVRREIRDQTNLRQHNRVVKALKNCLSYMKLSPASFRLLGTIIHDCDICEWDKSFLAIELLLLGWDVVFGSWWNPSTDLLHDVCTTIRDQANAVPARLSFWSFWHTARLYHLSIDCILPFQKLSVITLQSLFRLAYRIEWTVKACHITNQLETIYHSTDHLISQITCHIVLLNRESFHRSTDRLCSKPERLARGIGCGRSCAGKGYHHQQIGLQFNEPPDESDTIRQRRVRRITSQYNKSSSDTTQKSFWKAP